MHQFIHIDTFGLSRQSTKKGAKSGRRTTARWTVDEIIAELTRKEGACDHVEKPAAPVIVFGKDPEVVAAEIKRDVAAAKDPRGRKLRADAQVLMSGVASWPVRRADVDDAGMIEYRGWEKATVDMLRARWGDRLQYVLRHSDEEFLHVHYGVTAELDRASGRYSIEDLHPGMAARAKARSEAIAKGETPKRGKLEAAMRNGLREFQEQFYHAVSVRFGHTKDGPKRRRLTRAEWKAQQAIAQKQANVISERDALRTQLAEAINANPSARDNEALLTLARNLELRERDEREKRIRLEQREDFLRRRLAAESERADTAEKEVSRLSGIVRAMKSWLGQATGMIKRLLSGAEKIADRRPEWMPEDVWHDIARHQKEARVEAALEDQIGAIEIRESRGRGRTEPGIVKKKVA